jgi:hypothetical protein
MTINLLDNRVTLHVGNCSALIELNPEYAKICEDRLRKEWREEKPTSDEVDMGPLFAATPSTD